MYYLTSKLKLKMMNPTVMLVELSDFNTRKMYNLQKQLNNHYLQKSKETKFRSRAVRLVIQWENRSRPVEQLACLETTVEV